MDSQTLKAWCEAMMFRAENAADSEGGLRIARANRAGSEVVLKHVGSESWSISHSKRIDTSRLQQDWKGPVDGEPPIATLSRVVRALASTFPLVDAEVIEGGAEVEVRLTAPLFASGLTPQAFALTLSSMVKASDVFEQMLAERKARAAEWAMIEAEASKREREIQEQYERRMAEQEAHAAKTGS